jgi:hypothetical protein
MITRILAALFLIGLCVGSCEAQETPNAKPATICEVLKSPTRYRSRWLVIKAVVLSDRMHATLVKDESCPRWGLPIEKAPGDEDESIVNLQNYIMNTGRPGTLGKKITGKVYGRVLYHGSLRSIAFELYSVQDLELEAIPSQ